MLLETAESLLQSTAIMFLLCFALLFLIYYVTSPMYTEYDDRKSRLFYSFINSFYYSLVLAILFGVLPPLSDTYGVLASIAMGIVIILVTTITQIYAIALLVRSGLLKMRRKRRVK